MNQTPQGSSDEEGMLTEVAAQAIQDIQRRTSARTTQSRPTHQRARKRTKHHHPPTHREVSPEGIDTIALPQAQDVEGGNLISFIQKELDIYQSMNSSKLSPKIFNDTDLLNFWRFHSKSLPYLSRVARWALSVQSSVAESERQFSQSGRVNSKLRMSMGANTLWENSFLGFN